MLPGCETWSPWHKAEERLLSITDRMMKMRLLCISTRPRGSRPPHTDEETMGEHQRRRRSNSEGEAALGRTRHSAPHREVGGGNHRRLVPAFTDGVAPLFAVVSRIFRRPPRQRQTETTTTATSTGGPRRIRTRMDSKPSGSDTSGSDYSLTSGQHHSYKKSFGRFLKKLSPKPRGRSKSPASRNKSWITVEYRNTGSGDSRHDHQQLSSSSSLVDDRMLVSHDQRRPGCQGEDSMRKQRRHQPQPMSKAGGFGFFQTLTHGCRRKPCGADKHTGGVNRAASESELINCRISRDVPECLLKKTDFVSAAIDASAKGAAFSDENLSKADARDQHDAGLLPTSQSIDIYRKLRDDGGGVGGAGRAGGLRAESSALPSSQSEDSIFVSTYVPSYIRVSCALSGYSNYRRRSPGQYGTALDADVSRRRPVLTSTKYPLSPVSPGQQPLGQSLVERRLQKFESPSSEAAPTAPPTKTCDQKQQRSPPIPVCNADRTKMADGEEAGTVTSPVPVKELICSFNRLTLNEDGFSSPNATCRAPSAASATVQNGPSTAPLSNGVATKPAGSDGHRLEDEDVAQTGGQEHKRSSSCDGQYFRQAAAAERFRLEHLCAEYEGFLDSNDVSEEVLEKVRLAIGKAKLLLGRKFKTFEELVERNLKPDSDHEQIPNDADLDGYWKLVCIEISDINKCFNSLADLKPSEWVAESDAETDAADTSHTSADSSKSPPSVTKRTTKHRTPKSPSKVSPKVAEGARQRLKEAKLSAMEKQRKLKMLAGGDNPANDVQIFVS